MPSTTLVFETPATRALLPNEERNLFAYICETLMPEIRATNYCFYYFGVTFDAELKTNAFAITFTGDESPNMAPLESMRAPIRAILNAHRLPSFEDDPVAFETYSKMCAVLDAEHKHQFDMILLQCAARSLDKN